MNLKAVLASAFGLGAGCLITARVIVSLTSTWLYKSSWSLNTLLKNIKSSSWRTGEHGLFNSLPNSCSQDWDLQPRIISDCQVSQVINSYLGKTGRPSGTSLNMREERKLPPQIINTVNRKETSCPVVTHSWIFVLLLLFLSRYEIVF